MNSQIKKVAKEGARSLKRGLINLYQQVIDIPISNQRLLKVKKYSISNTDIIKVGFIVQMPELWDKQSEVYELMLHNDSFDPWLIIVPAYDNKNDRIENYGDEKEFYIKMSYGKYILAFDKGEWHDIQNDDFDYLFYQRPYDAYLPTVLSSNHTSKYTRICYIPYATPEMKNTGIYPYGFFKNVYFGFMEDESAANYNSRRFHIEPDTRFLNLGYPVFEKCMSLGSVCSYKKVLWTPRWSYHPIVGGSHFFEYVNKLADYPWGDAELIVRPHPMMWGNFLKEKRITEEEISVIEKKWQQHGITVDQNKEIETTFLDIDILISDRSSIIPMFFMTGKPIIYCEKPSDYGPLFSDILPGIYVAKEWNDVKNYLSKLLDGHDEKKKIREDIIKQRFAQHRNASKSIVQCIYNDAQAIDA